MLRNKVVLVTGASSGIGRAIAVICAQEGARIVVSDIAPEGGQETVARVREIGGDAVFCIADIGKPEDMQSLVSHAVAHYGRIDVACNNAGITGPHTLTADYPLEAWLQVININLSGVFYGLKYQIEAMLKTGGGSIINVASILGVVGFEAASAYTAAKHGVVGLTQTAALEYGARGIRINAVGPGFIHTPMTTSLDSDAQATAKVVGAHPIGRLGRAEEVAELVVWLASDRASFVTGAYYPVDGGYLAR